MSNAALAARHVTKRFGPIAALDDISFSLAPGEIRAICGENGAGKSTFVKILMGIYAPDAGEIEIDGRLGAPTSPQHAQALGLGIVAQELSLAPRLSIVDNIWLGSPRVPVLYRIPHLRAEARRALDLLGLGDWYLDREVGTLSIGQRQLVEIARLIARNSKVLILDEPTATLDDAEIARLMAVLRRLKSEGHAVIYITHRLGEVFDLCDSITVLRNGRHIATEPIGAVTRDSLVGMMLGRSFGEMYPARAAPSDTEPGLVVRDLVVPGLVHGLSFEARRGAILGLAGQVGSGAHRITRALAGLVPEAAGTVLVGGRRLELGSVPAAMAANVVLLSEDRAVEGLFHQLTVAENAVATSLAGFRRNGFLNWRALRSAARERAESVGVDTKRLASRAGLLSGGNQQKVLFARALGASRNGTGGVLLMNEPTRGIDVGARADIYRLMRALCAKGYTLVMTSSDLEEMVGLSDSVITIYRGRAVARYDGEAIDAGTILADITHPTGASPTVSGATASGAAA